MAQFESIDQLVESVELNLKDGQKITYNVAPKHMLSKSNHAISIDAVTKETFDCQEIAVGYDVSIDVFADDIKNIDKNKERDIKNAYKLYELQQHLDGAYYRISIYKVNGNVFAEVDNI